MLDPVARHTEHRTTRSSTSGTAPPLAYRGDGTRQAWDTGTATPYDDDDRRRAARRRRARRRRASGRRIKRFNATLVNYLFLLYFDTRAGYCDTGPYAVPGHPERTLLVRDFYRLGAERLLVERRRRRRAVPEPHRRVRARGRRRSRVTDFGTSNHTPEDYLDRLVGFGAVHDRRLRTGEVRPVRARRDRRHRRAPCAGAVGALPQHRGDGPRREDPLRRLRVLHVPATVRRTSPASPTSSTGPCRATFPSRSYQLLSAIEGDNAAPTDDGAYYGPIAVSIDT